MVRGSGIACMARTERSWIQRKIEMNKNSSNSSSEKPFGFDAETGAYVIVSKQVTGVAY